MKAAYDECERLVRTRDADRAVSVLFAPAGARRHLLALYAFNIETARIRDQITQPLPGEIRLQWWRDRIQASAAGAAGPDGSGHPIADALIDTIRTFALPVSAFEQHLEGRIFDLYDDPMASRADFEAYAGETASCLIMLAAMILDHGRAAEAAEAAGPAGVAQVAAGVLRLLPIHRARGQIFLPADILASAGSTGAALTAGEPEPTARAVAAMAAFAREHFSQYRAARVGLPASLRAAFLPAEMTGVYLRRLEAGGLSEMTQPSRVGPFRRSWTYWRAMRR